jgi:hypothetical protein
VWPKGGKAQARQLDSDAMAAETDTAASAEEVEHWEACFCSAAVAPVPCRPARPGCGSGGAREGQRARQRGARES